MVEDCDEDTHSRGARAGVALGVHRRWATLRGNESSDCHANGIPVTAAEKVEVAHQRIETCRHLYQMMGDHSLSPMQMEAVRVEWNTRWCSSSGFVPGRN
jgi:hypothetical protein